MCQASRGSGNAQLRDVMRPRGDEGGILPPVHGANQPLLPAFSAGARRPRPPARSAATRGSPSLANRTESASIALRLRRPGLAAPHSVAVLVVHGCYLPANVLGVRRRAPAERVWLRTQLLLLEPLTNSCDSRAFRHTRRHRETCKVVASAGNAEDAVAPLLLPGPRSCSGHHLPHRRQRTNTTHSPPPLPSTWRPPASLAARRTRAAQCTGYRASPRRRRHNNIRHERQMVARVLAPRAPSTQGVPVRELQQRGYGYGSGLSAQCVRGHENVVDAAGEALRRK